MKIETMPVAKTVIQQCSGDELTILTEFAKSKEYELLEEMARREKYHRYEVDFLTADTPEKIAFLRGLSAGIDFIIDVVARAKEEVKDRVGEKVDSDGDIQ